MAVLVLRLFVRKKAATTLAEHEVWFRTVLFREEGFEQVFSNLQESFSLH